VLIGSACLRMAEDEPGNPGDRNPLPVPAEHEPIFLGMRLTGSGGHRYHGVSTTRPQSRAVVGRYSQELFRGG
jgi:hypothetical protein